MKKIFLTFSLALVLGLTGCGDGGEEAKALLQRILNLVGIPHSIVVNICQDDNDNGFCESTELQAKLTINKGDTVESIFKKLQFEEDGSYILRDFDPSKKILLELVDNSTLNNSNEEVVLSYNPQKNVTEQELSILQSLIDNNLLKEEDLFKIKASDKRALVDAVLLENLFQNQTLLKENNLSQQNATALNLEYIAEGLRDINISGDFIDNLEACENNSTCEENFILDTNQQTEMDEEEAKVIAETNSTKGTGDKDTIITHEENDTTTNSDENSTSSDDNATTNSDDNSDDDSSSDGSNNEKTTKNGADGYIVKLSSPAKAFCGGITYESDLVVGDKGLITFTGVTLPDNCHIFIPEGATIDSNNNGVLDATDKVLNFSMKGPSDASFISPLTTLLLEKEAKGEDVTEFKKMVKDFDPVASALNIANSSGENKIKLQKLMLLMEVLKTAMNESPNGNISNIDISSIISTESNELIDDFNLSVLYSSFPTSLQSIVETKADSIKKFIKTIDSLDLSKIDINSFYIKMSDGGENIEDAINSSLKSTLPSEMNLLVFIGKADANLSTVYNDFNAMKRGPLTSMGKPIAKAGVDVTVMQGLPVTLNGMASLDINGHIVSYVWKEDDTTLGSTATFTKNNFSVGKHNITLMVTDNDGATGVDNLLVQITEDSSIEDDSPIPINDLISGEVSFKNETNNNIPTPSDAQIRIVPSRFQNDKSRWNGLSCVIASDGTFGRECYTDGNENSVREAFNDASETYQIVIYKNHIEPDKIGWNCGEDVYRYVGESESRSSWSNMEVTPEDYQDRSAEECSNSSYVLKKTGQTKSYDQEGNEVTDKSVKDDGFYQKGITPSYTRDDAKEIVTDNLSNLQWQDDEEAKIVAKPWVTQANYDAENYSDTTGDTATTYCNQLTLGGYSDWRLPTRKELFGIVEFGVLNPSIDVDKFKNVGSSYYWSATTNSPTLNNNAWIVSFFAGPVNYDYKDHNYSVRCLRAE